MIFVACGLISKMAAGKLGIGIAVVRYVGVLGTVDEVSAEVYNYLLVVNIKPVENVDKLLGQPR